MGKNLFDDLFGWALTFKKPNTKNDMKTTTDRNIINQAVLEDTKKKKKKKKVSAPAPVIPTSLASKSTAPSNNAGWIEVNGKKYFIPKRQPTYEDTIANFLRFLQPSVQQPIQSYPTLDTQPITTAINNLGSILGISGLGNAYSSIFSWGAQAKNIKNMNKQRQQNVANLIAAYSTFAPKNKNQKTLIDYLKEASDSYKNLNQSDTGLDDYGQAIMDAILQSLGLNLPERTKPIDEDTLKKLSGQL